MDETLVIWQCLHHPDYTLTAPANSNPKCNYGVKIRRHIVPCNKLMWTPEIPWAEMGVE